MALLPEGQQELQRIDQMRVALKQPLALPQRLEHLPNVPVFEIAQASMNDSSRATGRACGEIVLLDQKGAASSPRAFPRNGDSIDSAANHNHVETLALQRRSWSSFARLDAYPCCGQRKRTRSISSLADIPA